MCHGIIACPVCGEWLDEFSAPTHACENKRGNVAPEPVLEKPLVEVVVLLKQRKNNHD